MKRRDFLKSSALLAVAAGEVEIAQAASVLKGITVVDDDETTQQAAEEPLIASAPMLQNYAETSVGIAFAVSDMANGYVIVGERPDLSDGRKVMSGGYRLTEITQHVVQVRITGLRPATTYYYRIGADRIAYKGGYDMKILSNEEAPEIYHFTTAGAVARPHFCVINDTHANWAAFGLAVEKMDSLNPSCIVWNGDACNVEETVGAQTRIFLKPQIEREGYATGIPYLFCPGNHDLRGMANRHLERVWMYRQPEEHSPRDWDLGRNFAVRLGDIALIGLDTGEDKMDTNPLFAGLFNSSGYRRAQTDWLRDALQQEGIRTAPYLVAFCHIPLFDDNPRHNPGDIAPADKDPQYSTDFAMWQRTCATLWAPLLEDAGCQLVITAHQHRYRYDAPSDGRTWAQIVGGGPEHATDTSDESPGEFPTVIEGKAEGGKLVVTIHNLRTHTVQDTFTFRPRKKPRRKS